MSVPMAKSSLYDWICSNVKFILDDNVWERLKYKIFVKLTKNDYFSVQNNFYIAYKILNLQKLNWY